MASYCWLGWLEQKYLHKDKLVEGSLLSCPSELKFFSDFQSVSKHLLLSNIYNQNQAETK